MKRMTFREYLHYINALEIEIDVYVEGLDGCAVIGGEILLMPAGEEYFKDALDKCFVEEEGLVEWNEDETSDEDGIPTCAYKAEELLFSLAGYCSVDNFSKWFEGENAKLI